jgi:hypothetical protein
MLSLDFLMIVNELLITITKIVTPVLVLYVGLRGLEPRTSTLSV